MGADAGELVRLLGVWLSLELQHRMLQPVLWGGKDTLHGCRYCHEVHVFRDYDSASVGLFCRSADATCFRVWFLPSPMRRQF